MKDYLKLDSSKYLSIAKSNFVGFRKQRGFKIKINEIKVVGIKGQLSLDDEYLYICMVDKNGASHNVNSYFLNESSVNILIDYFNFSTEYFDMPYEFYAQNKSMVVFPNELKGKNLYKKWHSNLSSLTNSFYQLIGIKYASEGILTDEVKSFLEIKQ